MQKVISSTVRFMFKPVSCWRRSSVWMYSKAFSLQKRKENINNNNNNITNINNNFCVCFIYYCGATHHMTILWILCELISVIFLNDCLALMKQKRIQTVKNPGWTHLKELFKLTDENQSDSSSSQENTEGDDSHSLWRDLWPIIWWCLLLRACWT